MNYTTSTTPARVIKRSLPNTPLTVDGFIATYDHGEVRPVVVRVAGLDPTEYLIGAEAR